MRYIESYVHTKGQIGVLLELEVDADAAADSDEFRQLARDLVLHIAGAKPKSPGELLEQPFLHVRGVGHPPPTIACLLKHLNVRAIDCQTGEFFDVEAAKASFGSWARYRDQIVGLQAGDDEKQGS